MTSVGKLSTASEVVDHLDAEALRRIAEGETSALAGLYQRHHFAIERFIAHATNYAHDVEDVVHSTFLTAARAARSFDGRESCRPWLLGIASRLLHRRRRTLARLTRAMSALAMRDAANHVDPHPRMTARDELDTVRAALARMSEPKRVVLLLAEVEGLTSAQISAILGVAMGTVASRLHHARRELRKHLSPFDGDDP